MDGVRLVLLGCLLLTTSLYSTLAYVHPDEGTDELPIGVDDMCYDVNGYLWVAGLFNLAGSARALNVARYDPDNAVWDMPFFVGINASLELAANNEDDLADEAYAGSVKVIKCPSTGDYIYVGGFFSYAYTAADASQDLESGLVAMSLDQHTEVNNMFRFNTDTLVIEPLLASGKTAAAYNGFFNSDDNSSFVATIECIDAACVTSYVGGYFDTAIGDDTVMNVVKLDGTDWSAPTIAAIGAASTNTDGTSCSNRVAGADGYVLSVSIIATDMVYIAGAFLDVGCITTSSLVRYVPTTDKIECIQSGTDLVCAASVEASAACCWSVVGPIYDVTRISETTAVVSGNFAGIDSNGKAVDGAILVTQSDINANADINGDNVFGGGTIQPIFINYPRFFNGIGRTFECFQWSGTPTRCSNGALGFFGNETFSDITQPSIMSVEFNTFDSVEGADRPTETTVETIFPVYDSNQFSPDLATNATQDVRAIMYDATYDTDYVFVGGTIDHSTNIYRLKLSDRSADLLPDSVTYDEDHAGLPTGFSSCFSDSDGTAYQLVSGAGATFCCPNGHICPSDGLAIECDSGYGFYCSTGATEVECCPAGYYCSWPGVQTICPKGSYCPEGSTSPTACTWMGWFAICNEEGLEAPAKTESLVFAFFMILTSFVMLPIVIAHLMSTWEKQRAMLAETFMAARRLAFIDASKEDDPEAGEGRRSSLAEGDDNETEEPAALSTPSPQANPTPAPAAVAPAAVAPADVSSAAVAPAMHLKMESIPPKERASIEFTDLFVSIQKGGKTKYLLKDITGTLEAGKVCAVMGPSGCGKTTFLSAMSNRINGGKVGGTFKTNGKERPLSALQHFLGFVPQEDVMHRDLSVYQVLAYQCALRADKEQYPPGSIEQEEKVYSIMNILGLMHVKDSLIGDENRRGISGGQRKRVNIGMELMQNPKILFLDEPTSGLDSTTTVELLQYLHKYAATGLNISLVIHQPRFECLQYLDNTVLLKPTPEGGRAVFVGNMMDAVEHFAEVGLPCPDRVNPTDFFLDIMSDKEARTNEGKTIEQHWYEVAPVIAKRNADREIARLKALKSTPFIKKVGSPMSKSGGRNSIMSRSSFVSRSSFTRIKVSPDEEEDENDDEWVWQPPPVWRQIQFQTLRSLQQQYNNLNAVTSNFAFLSIVGMMIGFLGMATNQEFFIVVLAMGLTSTLNGVKIFGSEMAIARREGTSGISSSAYFLGKIIASIPVSILNPCAFLGVYVYISANVIFFSDYFIILIVCTFATQAIGVIISLTVSPQNSQVAAMLICLLFGCFAGVNPSIADMAETGGITNALSQMSYARWTYGSLVLHNSYRMSKCELSVVLPELYSAGHISLNSTGFVTDVDFASMNTDLNNELISLVVLSACAIFLAGCLLWVEGIYGEGLEEMVFRYHGAVHYARKRINEFTFKHFGYKWFNTNHAHKHGSRTFEDKKEDENNKERVLKTTKTEIRKTK